MDATNIFALIGGMAAVTYATRGPVLALAGRVEMPALVRHYLEMAPSVAMATLGISFILFPGGEYGGVGSNAAVYAGFVTLVVVYVRRTVLLAAPVGVGALNLFEWMLG